jgi:chromosome transmission fidelity protein 4
MHPKSNDISTSKTFSKSAWHKDANLIAIPTFKEVQFYERDLWQLKFKIELLLDENEKANIQDTLVSIVKFSPDGKSILLCSTPNDTIYIHSIITKTLIFKYSYLKSKSKICSIAWNLQNEVLFCDLKGQMGQMGINSKNDDNLFMDDLLSIINNDDSNDDEMIILTKKKPKNDLKSPTSKKRKRIMSDNDDSDENSNDSAKSNVTSSSNAMLATINEDEIDLDDLESLDKLKQKTVNEIKYEYDHGEDIKQSKKIDNFLKNQDQFITKDNLKENMLVQLKHNLQPFQCSSTPFHLTERYMVWNTVGIIKQFNNDSDKSIDIEFHNVSYHHTIHINNNQYGYTMADLSKEAVLLACPGSKYDDFEGENNTIEQQFNDSRLVCILLNAWDNTNKEWSISMPKKEFIKCICVSNILCACLTNHKFLRVYGLSGIQREIIAIPCAQVLSMSAFNSCIFISYYKAHNTFSDNLISYSLIYINDTSLTEHGDLALSDKAKLIWMGFSDEGNPYYYDSNGYLFTKYLSSKLWTPVCNLRSGLKHKSDTYWLVGISERTQSCRTILCRSSQQYPSVLPKPTIDLVPIQIPLCENSNEKTQLEQDYWKSKIILNNIKNYEGLLQNSLNFIHTNGDNTLSIGNIQFDQDDVDELNEKLYKQSRETLMKLFILACKSNKEQRAYEIAGLMDTHALQLAIKYATKARYLQLAQQLNRLAEIKSSIEFEIQQQQQKVQYEQPKMSIGDTNSRNPDAVIITNETQRQGDDDIIPLTNQSEVSSTFGDNCLTPSLSSSGIPLTNTRFNPFKTSNSQQNTPNVGKCLSVASPSVINEIEEKMIRQKEKENHKEKDVWKPTPTRKLTKSKVSSGGGVANQASPGLDRFFSKTNKNADNDTAMDE